ncbi:MAG: hypothetical protein DRO63_05210 [Candidatus Gerdarchaeota archaeon]|nr:MAG: hypothetical protein DRO63_05210 [Candidatus Gerdarchaeota archaeon]
MLRKRNWCRGRASIPRPPDVPSNLALYFFDLIMSQAPILANEHAWTSETKLGHLDTAAKMVTILFSYSILSISLFSIKPAFLQNKRKIFTVKPIKFLLGILFN